MTSTNTKTVCSCPERELAEILVNMAQHTPMSMDIGATKTDEHNNPYGVPLCIVRHNNQKGIVVTLNTGFTTYLNPRYIEVPCNDNELKRNAGSENEYRQVKETIAVLNRLQKAEGNSQEFKEFLGVARRALEAVSCYL